jgi:hypothetical protein
MKNCTLIFHRTLSLNKVLLKELFTIFMFWSTEYFFLDLTFLPWWWRFLLCLCCTLSFRWPLWYPGVESWHKSSTEDWTFDSEKNWKQIERFYIPSAYFQSMFHLMEFGSTISHFHLKVNNFPYITMGYIQTDQSWNL